MMKMVKLIAFMACLISFAPRLYAQKPQVKTRIDTSRILIGDQVNILMELEQKAGDQYQFPVFKDTLVKNVEILSVSQPDTQRLDGDRLRLSQRLLVTSFDTGFYVIPPFYFPNLEGFDSLKSEALPLEVLTLEIDTTKGIADIKSPFEVPLTFMEILPYIVVALLLLGIAYLVWNYYRKKKLQPVVEPIRLKPVEPAHIWALRNLDELAKEKLWQKGKVKLYHSRVSEILRSYIEFRFDIRAMEQTTREIFDSFEKTDLVSEDLLNTLHQSLELSDLVKFAKWNPLPDENEKTLEIAYEFVLKTKKIINLRQSEGDQALEKEVSHD